MSMSARDIKGAASGEVGPAYREQSSNYLSARQPIEPEDADIQRLHPGDRHAEDLFEVCRQGFDTFAPIHPLQRGVKGRCWRQIGHSANSMNSGADRSG